MRYVIRARHSARPLPVELKLLLAGGVVVAGWLLGSLLGAPSASADEAPSEPDTASVHQQPGLFGTVTGLVDAVTETVDTTLTTVTGVADQATQPIVAIVDTTTAIVDDTTAVVADTVETITPKASKPAGEAPVTKTATTTSEPAVVEPVPSAPEPPAAAPAAATPAAAPVHVVHHPPAVAPKHAPPAPPRSPEPADPVRADNAPPPPVPTAPGDSGCVVTVSHAGGDSGRDLLAVLGPRASAVVIQPIVGAVTSGFVGMGTGVGLPPTSPD